jgi:hypothetical protein
MTLLLFSDHLGSEKPLHRKLAVSENAFSGNPANEQALSVIPGVLPSSPVLWGYATGAERFFPKPRPHECATNAPRI